MSDENGSIKVFTDTHKYTRTLLEGRHNLAYGGALIGLIYTVLACM